MTVTYLKYMSTMLAIVSIVRKGGLKGRFSAEPEILKLMFAFNQINYAGYITYQHAYLNDLPRKDNSIVKGLITIGHGASCSRDWFSTIHEDLVTEHFRRLPAGYSTDI